VSGGLNLTKTGLGTLTLTGTNTYSGVTVIAAGSIVYGSASLPSRTQTLSGDLRNSVGADATVVSVLGNSGNASLAFGNYTSAGGLTDGGTMNFVLQGGDATTNKITVTAGGVNSILRSRAFFNGSNFAYVGTGGVLRAPVYGTDAGFVTAAGALTAASHNLVSASLIDQPTVTVLTLKLDGTGAVDLAQLAGTTLQVGSGSGTSAGGILRSGGGSTIISGGSVTTGAGLQYIIRTDTAADSLTISSNLQRGTDNVSANHVVKSGAGTLVLGGALNTYFGNTYINSGTVIDNSFHNPLAPQTAVGFYQVAAGATFGGTGTIGSDGLGGVLVTGTSTISGTLAPGDGFQLLPENQTGVLDFGGAVSLATGSTYAIQLGGNTPGDGMGFYDQFNMIATAGTITLQTGVTLSLSLVNSFAPDVSDSFFILTRADGGVFSNFFNGATEGSVVNLGGGYTGTITYLANWDGSQFTSSLTGGNDVAIYNVAVPEPSPAALCFLGALAGTVLLRRRTRN
jgi:autotransporter-associated beta strand protein